MSKKQNTAQGAGPPEGSPSSDDPRRAAIEAEGDAIDRSSLPAELTPDDTEEQGVEEQGGDESADGKIEIEIGGRTLRVDPEAAAAIWQLQQANSQVQPPADKKEKVVDPYAGLDRLLFEDPGQAIQRIRENIRQEVRSELTSEYNVAENRKQFWNDFFSENQDLRVAPEIVDAVMSANLNILRPLTVAGARKKLAELTRQRIAKLSRSGNSRSPQLESGGRRTSLRPAKQEEEGPKTLTGFLRERAAKRRQAQLGKE